MSEPDAASPAPSPCIAGGGTAGHLLPGLAVADALVDAGVTTRPSIHFVGSERGLETTLVPAAGFPLDRAARPGHPAPALAGQRRGAVSGVVRGVLVGHRPGAPAAARGSWWCSAATPACACTVGAILWRVPIVVTEQNARAGAANRLAGRFAKAAAVPFAETDLPRAVVTGNPVRPEILAVDRAPRPRAGARARSACPHDRTVIAVFSGSLGLAPHQRGGAGAGAERWADRADLADPPRDRRPRLGRRWPAEAAASLPGAAGLRLPGGPLRGPHGPAARRRRPGRVPGRRHHGGRAGRGRACPRCSCRCPSPPATTRPPTPRRWCGPARPSWCPTPSSTPTGSWPSSTPLLGRPGPTGRHGRRRPDPRPPRRRRRGWPTWSRSTPVPEPIADAADRWRRPRPSAAGPCTWWASAAPA